MKQYRQGDVLIETASVPKDAKPLTTKIVERGEATGHKHEFLNGGVTLLESRGEMFIAATEPSPLVHDEHDTIIIPEGTYRVIRQREFDGTQERNVYD